MKIKKIKYLDSNIIEEQTSEVAIPVKITAIGFIVKETENYITLAREQVGDEWRGQISIPKKSITK